MQKNALLSLLNLPIPLRILNSELASHNDKPAIKICLRTTNRGAKCPACGRVSLDIRTALNTMVEALAKHHYLEGAVIVLETEEGDEVLYPASPDATIP